MSDEDDDVLVGTEDFESWYDGDQVGIEFLADGVTKVINKEDFRDFCKFVSQTENEFILAEDNEVDNDDASADLGNLISYFYSIKSPRLFNKSIFQFSSFFHGSLKQSLPGNLRPTITGKFLWNHKKLAFLPFAYTLQHI